MTKEEQNRLMRDFIRDQGMLEDLEKYVTSKKGNRFTEKPLEGNKYYFVSSHSNIICTAWDNDSIDNFRFDFMPLWRTREGAERYKEVQIFIKEKAKHFERNGNNWFLCLNCLNGEHILPDNNNGVAYPNVDYFNSKKVCKEIIDAIGYDDLKKYYFLVEE